VIGVGVSSSTLEAAAFCDALARFYGAGGSLPIGLAEDGPKLDDSPMLRAPLSLRDEAGQPVFRTTVRSVIDTADPPVLFRNALLTQQEKQAIVVLAGPATNLARTLALARDTVAAKVQLLVMAAGAFDGTTVDSRVRADVGAARKIFAEWPSPVVVVGVETGNAVPYSDQILLEVPNSPLTVAYRAYREKSGVATQAVLAALYAANSKAEYWKLSRPGQVEVASDGRTAFKESSNGTHRHLIIDPAFKDQILEALSKMSVARPATGGRGQRN
jgi:hypothetical protein